MNPQYKSAGGSIEKPCFTLIVRMDKEQIKMGMSVIYWAIIDEKGKRSNPTQTTVTSEPWEVCGTWVCKIQGVSGGVDIEHLEITTFKTK